MLKEGLDRAQQQRLVGPIRLCMQVGEVIGLCDSGLLPKGPCLLDLACAEGRCFAAGLSC